MYPQINRDTKTRKLQMTDKQRQTAKKFGWEYFDMKGICYGGYTYDGRWIPIVKRFKEYYNLKQNDKVLDIGCSKGYLIYDLLNLGMDAYGIDISKYAIDCSPPEIRWRLKEGDAKDLHKYKDKQFDLVISINTIHNLREDDCRKAIREIQRIGKHAFIMVDSYRNEEERQRIMEWNITALTIKSDSEWKELFKEEGYTGDYFWFIP
ncbi:MAG: class I SAM-dependent methyltransferase [Actinobacteria bacterium]|nr:class I SAM-dependent methyltransferase [Actinomycetota bacterium]MBE3114651.1 class I SAM-dependent methyltransferase [Actinomycetota bacterium]